MIPLKKLVHKLSCFVIFNNKNKIYLNPYNLKKIILSKNVLKTQLLHKKFRDKFLKNN